MLKLGKLQIIGYKKFIFPIQISAQYLIHP